MEDLKRTLVADSGATKTDWVCLTNDASGFHSAYWSGPGLNPLLTRQTDISDALLMVAKTFGHDFDRIRFYGAGVGTPEVEDATRDLIDSVFNCPDIQAKSDVLGAAKALYGNRTGIACIMGTGSSSCHFDGSGIDFRIPSLGYILDDDGGGVAFCRRLLTDVFKGLAPKEMCDLFFTHHAISREDLLRHLYREPAPNRWMASFFPFIADHRAHPYISRLVDSQINRFLDKEFAGYPPELLQDEGVSFVGSVAFTLKSELEAAFRTRGWRLGPIIRKPIENIQNLI